MKKASNIVLIMSGGVGNRFGGKIPKQYCYMNGKMIIEYAVDACKRATGTDDIVIVTSEEYENEIYDKFGFPTTVGGKNRTESLSNGLQYIHENYNCKKVIVANAVCPLMTSEQINRYFELLDQYDYVLTCWKVVSTLHRYDGKLVDRDDFFHVMEPEAYDFELLFKNYKSNYPVPYIFHQLPRESRGYYCFDYPYTMKITYANDVKIAGLLYEEYIRKPIEEHTKRIMNTWISSFERTNVTEWQLQIPNYMEDLASRWKLTDWELNPDAFSTCVFEAKSDLYGPVIVKFHAPGGRYDLEVNFYKLYQNPSMAKLLDYDEDYRVLLIQKIVPGISVKFSVTDDSLKVFFDELNDYFIPQNRIYECIDNVPDILSEFELNRKKAAKHTFEQNFRDKISKRAMKLWDLYFSEEDKFFLHRDIHRRNMLRGKNGRIKIIDPLGVVGPKEFEYTISVFIETKIHSEMFNTMVAYYSSYCDKERLMAALFITWVHKINEYVFVKKDDYEQAGNAIESLKKYFKEWL